MLNSAILEVIVGLVFAGKGARLEAWRMRHRGFMRLSIGLFLVALGAYMMYANSFFV